MKGRPKLRDGEGKDCQYRLRLTQKDRQLLDDLVEATGKKKSEILLMGLYLCYLDYFANQEVE